MAARDTYMIPVSLKDSEMEQPLNFGSFLKRNYSLKDFLVFVAVLSVYVILAFSTFIDKGGLLWLFIFSIGYFWLSLLLAGRTPTGLRGFSQISVLINYYMGINRSIFTQPDNSSYLFKNLTGIENIISPGKFVDDDQVIFTNGDIGKIYELKGNASRMTFPSDRENILRAVSNFYQNSSEKVGLIFDTVTSPQRVVEHVAALDAIDKNSDIQLPDMQLYADNQKEIIEEYVGKQFKSWSQYLMVRAVDEKELMRFQQWLNQAQNTGLIIQEYRPLSKEDTIRYLNSVYGSDNL